MDLNENVMKFIHKMQESTSNLYGRPNTSYHYIGINTTHSDASPSIHFYNVNAHQCERDALRLSDRFNNQILARDKDWVEIRLTSDTETDATKSHFQAAHEVIHLLECTSLNDVNQFEEGLATYNSYKHLNDNDCPANYKHYFEGDFKQLTYFKAFEHIVALEKANNGLDFVKVMRATSLMSKWSKKTFMDAGVKIRDEQIDFLLSKFN